ncbi:magnesium chelatase domain-containing protein [Streptomyces sp. NPDC059218]|uniref:magnesium chelatase domain-containing protein n=1 Tax=unclassified Streptomyces TaxID=2593676 RepID=UPI00367BF458
MTETLHTEPATAAASRAFEDAYTAARTARSTLYAYAIEYVARLIHPHLPEAATLIVDFEDVGLYEVQDFNGNALWHAPSAAGHHLPDGIVDEISHILADVSPFGSLSGAAGWKEAPQGLPFRTIRLPEPLTPELVGHWAVAVRPAARSFFPTLEGLTEVHAELSPGQNAFKVTGLAPECTREARDRIRAAITNAGYRLPDGALTVTVDGPLITPAVAADLVLAVTVLAAAGAIDGNALLEKVALIGELGLDGQVRPVADINEAVRIAYASGYHAAVVAEADLGNIDVAGIGVHGAANLRQALTVLDALASKK